MNARRKRRRDLERWRKHQLYFHVWFIEGYIIVRVRLGDRTIDERVWKSRGNPSEEAKRFVAEMMTPEEIAES